MKFAFASGTRPLAGYTLKRGIGRGGFGEVYFAISDAGKEVALKKIERNFEIELRGVAQCLNLRHSNLVELYDVKYDSQEEPWVVMEYIAGRSLKEILDANPQGLPRDEIISWFRGIAAGVAYLHDHGIVHRDLKPANIFDDASTVKIGDYGLSKYISTSRRSGHTESVGTCHYMAPEIGKGEYGKEIDLYALGVVLFEMLTGRVPFEGESSQEVLMKHLTDEPDLEMVAAEFRPLIAKALRKDPELRYSTVDAMLAEFDAAVDPGAGHFTPETEPEAEVLEIPPSAMLPTRLETPPSAMNSRQRSPLKEPPLYIGEAGEGIELGPVKHGPAKAPPLSRPGVSAPMRTPSRAGTATLPAAAAVRPTPARQPMRPAVPRSPGAQSSAGTIANGIVILAMFACLGVSIIAFPNIVPVAALLGLAYLIYAGVSELVQLTKTDGIRITAASPATDSPEMIGRQVLRMRTAWDRVGELSGSFLAATLVTGVLCLLMTALTGQLSADPLAVNFFVWLTISSSLGSWLILAAGKLWEPDTGEPWKRRFVLLMLGLVSGALSWGVSEMLLVNLRDAWLMPSLFGSLLPRNLHALNGAPTLALYLLYFGVTFSLIPWWKHTDPLREARLSIGAVAGVAIASLIFPFPQPWGLTIAVASSIAAQLAATWIGSAERRSMEARWKQTHG